MKAIIPKNCFLGGTCLRIIHNNTRFSEDLDFDNFDLKQTDFEEIAQIIEKQLAKQGYEVEIKNVFAGAFHCYIRFPKLLFNESLSGHIEQKILIQLDTEPHNFNFEPKNIILNKFDVFTTINTTPIDILLSQNFFALINRKRKKGHDFFDIVFLLKHTLPNYNYLEQKLNIENSNALKTKVLEVLKEVNLQEMAKDVSPFLFDGSDTKKVLFFREYINQVF